jgi:hypothetical protein
MDPDSEQRKIRTSPLLPGFEIITPPGYADEDWAEVVRRALAGEPFEPPPQDERYMSHAAPDLEQLIPRASRRPRSRWNRHRLPSGAQGP